MGNTMTKARGLVQGVLFGPTKQRARGVAGSTVTGSVLLTSPFFFSVSKRGLDVGFGTVTGDSARPLPSGPRPNLAPSRHPLSVGLSDLRSRGGGDWGLE